MLNKRSENRDGLVLRLLPVFGAIIPMLLGGMVIIGWILRIDILKSLSPDFIAMKPNAALSFILIGTSLYLLRSEGGKTVNRILHATGHACSSIVIGIASLTILQYLFGFDFGIDQLIFREEIGSVGTLAPGRMTLLASINFLLTGISLLLLNDKFKANHYLQILPIGVGLFASVDLLGYNYDIKPIYGYLYNQMAIHTAISFILLSLGILAARPERGMMRIITSKSYGGITMRRLIIGAIIIPTVLGWFFLQGIEAGLIDFKLALTLFGVTAITVLIIIIWWNARSLDRMDTKRQEAESQLQQRELQYRTLITEMGEGVLQTDLNENIALVNDQFCKLLGYTEGELNGQNAQRLFSLKDWDRISSKTALRFEGVSDRYEVQMIKKSGESIWVSVTGAPVFDVDGMIKGSVAIVTDISERKRVQLLNEAVYKIARAADSSRQLSDLYKAVHDVISEVMPATNFYISLYDRENDIISFPYFVDEEDTVDPPRKPGRGLTEYVLRTGRSLLCDEKMTNRLIQQDEAVIVGAPSPIWLGVPLITDEIPIGVMVVQHYRDPLAYSKQEKQMLEFVSDQVAKVIAHKKAEVELADSEHRFRNLYDNVPVGIYRTTPQGKILGANRALINMMGFSFFDELVKVDLEMSGYEDKQKREIFKEIIEDAGYIQKFESTWKRADGSIIHVSENAIAVRGDDGKIIYYEGMVEDITERKLVEVERERLIGELQTALGEVRTLSGLMPICASCKKIRDDTGYWNQIESYIETRASVQFSHGICPGCMEKLYPDYYQRINDDKSKAAKDDVQTA